MKVTTQGAWDRGVTQKLLNGQPLSIVFWDLECTNLSAMIGRVLCCSFKPLDAAPYTLRADKRPYKRRDVTDDAPLVQAIRDELAKYDVIVGHNSKLFDAKFLEGRLFKHQLEPREKRFHVDSMWTIRTNMRVSSKLQNIQEFAGLEDKKTPITWDDWARAGAFYGKGMDEVVKHCEQDVIVLEGVFKRLRPYIGELKVG